MGVCLCLYGYRSEAFVAFICSTTMLSSGSVEESVSVYAGVCRIQAFLSFLFFAIACVLRRVEFKDSFAALKEFVGLCLSTVSLRRSSCLVYF